MTSPHLPVCPHPDFQGSSECSSYGDFLQETDFRVGQVLEALKANGVDQNTLVIFTADNGGLKRRHLQKEYGHYSNMALNGAKKSIYEGGHRVPFLMRWRARIKPGKVVHEATTMKEIEKTVKR